ncbi:MAG: hypothetical protein HQK79_11205 [Desulfobacterales bacterium]|nr:hypothetical protein [Desulfobacterales bacterium]MBF0396899.1 hypothetical protein [Desulfobacterales bacterium]
MDNTKALQNLKELVKYNLFLRLTDKNKVIMELFVDKFFNEEASKFTLQELKNIFNTADNSFKFFRNYTKSQNDAFWDSILHKKNQ